MMFNAVGVQSSRRGSRQGKILVGLQFRLFASTVSRSFPTVKTFIPLALFALVTTPAFAQQVYPTPGGDDETGFVSIFDGRTAVSSARSRPKRCSSVIASSSGAGAKRPTSS
jgi:hypothetical protein